MIVLAIPLSIVTLWLHFANKSAGVFFGQVLFLENFPALEEGDRILYNNVGAYTMTLSPLFIRLFPAVHLRYKEGKYKLLRDQWDAENLIQQDILD